MRPTPLKCKNEYLVLALEKETAVQAVVYRPGVWQAKKANDLGDEHTRLRAP